MSAPFPHPYRTAPDSLDAIRADLDRMLGRLDAFAAAPDELIEPEAAEVLAREGRAMYLRRALEAAADLGADMLDALDAPRLVTPNFVPLDREAIGVSLQHAIDVLDALEGDADAEAEPDDEAGGDDELSLGWREVVSQADLGRPTEDAEHTLGAPERGPYAVAMAVSHYKPANDRRSCRCFANRAWNQVAWAAGANLDGEGEPEPGYDLPEGDDEKCGSEHDGREPDEGDQDLGSAIGDGDQRHWDQGNGQDHELVNEDGEESGGAFPPAARPLSPRRPDPMGFRAADDRRALARQARDAKARFRPEARRDPDELTIYRDGRPLWSGPYVKRDGVPTLGCST